MASDDLSQYAAPEDDELAKYAAPSESNEDDDPLKTGKGMLPGEGGPVAKPATDPVLKAYSETLNPQERYLDSLPPIQRRAATERMGAGNDPAIPILLTTGVIGAGTTIAREGLAAAGKSLLRSGLKSAAGSEIGGYGGHKIGQAIAGPEGARVGEQIGSTGGLIAGPFVDNSVYARMPLGTGRMFLSDADYAAARAGSKLAQRTADIGAGLRKPPAIAPPLTLPQNSTLSTIAGPRPLPAVIPSPSDLTASGPIEAQFVREIPKAQPPSRIAAPPVRFREEAQPAITAPPPVKFRETVPQTAPPRVAPPPVRFRSSVPETGSIAGPEGEGPIGSNPAERQVQTIMQKAVITPEEQSFVERTLGPDARMRPGEGISKWRQRVTGGFKAARARTEP